MERVPQGREELVGHLTEQIEFLRTSCELYDQGRKLEAKRLAVTLRVLLHNTTKSKALLAQLGVLDTAEFLNTAGRIDPRSLTADFCLVVVAMGRTVQYVPPMNDYASAEEWLPFETWWTKTPVLRTARSTKYPKPEDRLVFTRADLVLTVADTDGGAHVDPGLQKDYVELSRRNALGLVASYGRSADVPLGDPVPPSIRQAAHEVLRTYERNESDWLVGSSASDA